MWTPISTCDWMIRYSSGVSGSAFLRTLSSIPILPTSWSRPHQVEVASLVGREAHLLGQADGDPGDPLGMAGGVRVLRVDGRGQGPDHAEEEFLQLAIELAVGPLGADERGDRLDQLDLGRREGAVVDRVDGDDPAGGGLRVGGHGHDPPGGGGRGGRGVVGRPVGEVDAVGAAWRRELAIVAGRESADLADDHGRLGRVGRDPGHRRDVQGRAEGVQGQILEPLGGVGDPESADQAGGQEPVAPLAPERRGGRGRTREDLAPEPVGHRLPPGLQGTLGAGGTPAGPGLGAGRETDQGDEVGAVASGRGQAEPGRAGVPSGPPERDPAVPEQARGEDRRQARVAAGEGRRILSDPDPPGQRGRVEQADRGRELAGQPPRRGILAADAGVFRRLARLRLDHHGVGTFPRLRPTLGPERSPVFRSAPWQT